MVKFLGILNSNSQCLIGFPSCATAKAMATRGQGNDRTADDTVRCLGYTIHMAAQDAFQTTDQIHQGLAQNIATNLKQVGHEASVDSVIPVTSATSVPKSPHMEAIGAQMLGEDIVHVVGTTVGDLTMGVQKTRITPSKRFLDKFLERLGRKKVANK